MPSALIRSSIIDQSWMFGLNVSPAGYCASGQGVIIHSGVGVTEASGLYYASGVGVTINSGVGVTEASGLYYASGVGVIINSGVGVTVNSGVGVTLINPGTPIINNSGNPLVLSSGLSGGVMLWSSTCLSVTLKALVTNSGDVYVGGYTAGQTPYSGCGFVLSPGEAINIDVDNVGKIRVCTALSGNQVTYIAITA